MSDLSEMVSEGRQQIARGGEFEANVGKKLTELFDRVETHKRIEGYSGVHWKVDFVVDSNLVLEASVQRRLETKINSTFLRFVDVTRKFPNFKACLVFKELYVGFHKTRGKKFFPTSEYRTMLMHGFAIVSIDELVKLVRYAKGEATAVEVSSRPAGFNQKTMFSPKHLVGPRIMEVLAKGPLPRREIARNIGKNRSLVDDAIKLLPRVKKVSSYYGLDEDEIYRRLVKKGGLSGNQRGLVLKWLTERYLAKMERQGQCETKEFASEYGLNFNALSHFIHDLGEKGVIRRVRKGVWGFANPQNQTKL